MNFAVFSLGLPALLCSVAWTQTATPSLVAASSGKHLWVAIATSSGCRILHHAIEMGGPFCSDVAVLPELPAALAAHASELAILMPPAGSPISSAVYGLRAGRDPATGSWVYQPVGRLAVLPSIQSFGDVSNFVASDSGPLAWIGGAHPRLVQSTVSGWSELPLPQTLGPSPFLTAWSSGGARDWAVCSIDETNLVAWEYPGGESATSWSQTIWPRAALDLEMVIPGSMRPAVLSRGPAGLMTISYATATGLRKLGEITPPAESWTIVGWGEGFAITWIDAERALHLALVDPLSGAIGPAQALTPALTPTGDWIHLPLLGALTIGMLMAGFILRPPMEPQFPMPAGWDVFPMFRRINALAIDMIPGAIFALWITGARLSELMSMPSWTPELTTAAPAAIMIGFTGVWCFAFEVTLRATPGKFIFGGRVVRAPDGTADMRAGFHRAALRAILKCVVLFAPALGFLAFVHPLQQGLPETLSKTVVAQRRR